MNRDCYWCAYEKDLGEPHCRHPDHEDDESSEPCEGCKDCYTRDDAKLRYAPEGKN